MVWHWRKFYHLILFNSLSSLLFLMICYHGFKDRDQPILDWNLQNYRLTPPFSTHKLTTLGVCFSDKQLNNSTSYLAVILDSCCKESRQCVSQSRSRFKYMLDSLFGMVVQKQAYAEHRKANFYFSSLCENCYFSTSYQYIESYAFTFSHRDHTILNSLVSKQFTWSIW
jgi:hypothetical protein